MCMLAVLGGLSILVLSGLVMLEAFAIVVEDKTADKFKEIDKKLSDLEDSNRYIGDSLTPSLYDRVLKLEKGKKK